MAENTPEKKAPNLAQNIVQENEKPKIRSKVLTLAKIERNELSTMLKNLQSVDRKNLKQKITTVREEENQKEKAPVEAPRPNQAEEPLEAPRPQESGEEEGRVERLNALEKTLDEVDQEQVKAEKPAEQAKKARTIVDELKTEFGDAKKKFSAAKGAGEKFTVVLETIANVSVKMLQAFTNLMDSMKNKFSDMGSGALKSITSMGKVITLPAFLTDMLKDAAGGERALLVDKIKGEYQLVRDSKDKIAESKIHTAFVAYNKGKNPPATFDTFYTDKVENAMQNLKIETPQEGKKKVTLTQIAEALTKKP